MAQSGRAPGLGPGSRKFESCRGDQILLEINGFDAGWQIGNARVFGTRKRGSIPLPATKI